MPDDESTDEKEDSWHIHDRWLFNADDERHRFPNPYLYLTPFSLPHKTLTLRLALNLEPVRHYGLLKLLRGTSLAPSHSHGHGYSAALRTPGGPHAF
jgi:hypothetical protein